MASERKIPVGSSGLEKSIGVLNSDAALEEPQMRDFSRATIVAFALGLVAFWTWAYLTPIYEVVAGEGTVEPYGYIVPIQHLEGGKITQVLVEEGQPISEGDVILKLDSSALDAEIRKNRAQEKYQREIAFRSEAILAYPFESEGTGSSSATRATPLPPYIQYKVAQIDHLRAERTVTFAQRDANRLQLAKIRSEEIIVRQRVKRLNSLMADGRATKRDFEASKIELLQLEEKIESSLGQLATQSAEIARSVAQESELIARFRNEAFEQLQEANSQLAAIFQSTSLLEQRRANTNVVATTEGMIGALAVKHAQEVLPPGALVAEIVPQERGVFAEIEISASKIGGIKVGAQAKLKVLTHDYTRYGLLDATVASISPNSYLNEQGGRVYKVRLDFDRDAFLKGNLGSGLTPREIDPGMTVVADIRIGQKTVLTYLIKPLRAISDRAFSEV